MLNKKRHDPGKVFFAVMIAIVVGICGGVMFLSFLWAVQG